MKTIDKFDILLTIPIALCVLFGIQIGLMLTGCAGELPPEMDPPPEPKGVTETDYIIGLPDDVVIMTPKPNDYWRMTVHNGDTEDDFLHFTIRKTHDVENYDEYSTAEVGDEYEIKLIDERLELEIEEIKQGVLLRIKDIQ